MAKQTALKEKLIFIVAYFAVWVLTFIVQKPLFWLFQYSESAKESFSELLATIPHGFTMDLSTAGYFTAVPLLLLLIACFLPKIQWAKRTIDIYTYIFLALLSILFIADLFLYQYWGFRIDSTPLFYLKTPKDAMASATFGECIAALILVILYFYACYRFYRFIFNKIKLSDGQDFICSIPLVVLAGLLFIAIRGGVSVSTMNVGHAYFSQSTFVNHAAINPTWNFINSLTRDTDFKSQYRFMDDEKATQLVAQLNHSESDGKHHQIINTERPNVVLIVMEGIGSNVIETLGGVPGVAPNLCKYTEEGLVFTNFFASSFRTDRGLVAILSGYPAQPTTSLMKYPNKTQNTPIITQKFREAGYHTAFYYGGDDNFTNLHSFLVTAGYQTIVNEHDFSNKDMSTKWGAYDHVLLQRVKDDLKNELSAESQPFFKTILTLNSHEPFDVPSHVLEQPYLNSVHYADSCLGDFIEHYKKLEIWKNTVIILLPDHAYRYPESLSNAEPYRYRIPLIWLGGAVDTTQMKAYTKTCGQIDLAATLLNQLGLDSKPFIFSHDILDDSYPNYAYFSYNNGFGLVQQQDTALYDCDGNCIIRATKEETVDFGKAYLQKLYDDLSNR